MPLPALHSQPVPAAAKTAPAPELSLRGGRRPTWRPEREARGSALGVQSRSTRSECGKAIGEIAAAFPRLPRPLRGLAMTSRGRLLFHVTLYESFVRCRERTAGPLQRSNGGMPDKKCPPERFHKKEGSTKFVLPSFCMIRCSLCLWTKK